MGSKRIVGYDCTQKNHFYRSVSALFIQNKANPPIPMRKSKLTEQRWFSDSSAAFAHLICFDDLRFLFSRESDSVGEPEERCCHTHTKAHITHTYTTTRHRYTKHQQTYIRIIASRKIKPYYECTKNIPGIVVAV